jgi:hypothetical protein
MARAKDRETLIPIILDNISNGGTIRISCMAAGVSYRSFREWVQADPQLSAHLKKANSDFELRHVRNIQTMATDDWKASAWLLERKFPKRYSRRLVISEPPKATEDTGILVRVPQPKPKPIESDATDV